MYYAEIYALADLLREIAPPTLHNRLNGPHNGSRRFGGENSLSPVEKRSIYQHFNVSRVPAVFGGLSYFDYIAKNIQFSA